MITRETITALDDARRKERARRFDDDPSVRVTAAEQLRQLDALERADRAGGVVSQVTASATVTQ